MHSANAADASEQVDYKEGYLSASINGGSVEVVETSETAPYDELQSLSSSNSSEGSYLPQSSLEDDASNESSIDEDSRSTDST